MNRAKNLIGELDKLENRKKAEILQRFFKTGVGEYGEGDVFIGVSVPNIRRLIRNYRDLDNMELAQTLGSPVHEHRLAGWQILVWKYKHGDVKEKEVIYHLTMRNINHMNSWDLVDCTAPYIIGDYLLDKDLTPIFGLSDSKSLWNRRAAIISTFAFVRKKNYETTLRLAKKYIKDKEDLIHKSTGWMLREIGKRDQERLLDFLDDNCHEMPRVMLRYAIELLSEVKKEKYMNRRKR